MSRYIDADELLRELKRQYMFLFGTEEIPNGIGMLIENFPTADVRENVHGEWIVKDESYWRSHNSGDIQVNKAGLYCSECDKRLAKTQKYRNYCPNCGAMMSESLKCLEAAKALRDGLLKGLKGE